MGRCLNWILIKKTETRLVWGGRLIVRLFLISQTSHEQRNKTEGNVFNGTCEWFGFSISDAEDTVKSLQSLIVSNTVSIVRRTYLLSRDMLAEAIVSEEPCEQFW